MVTKESNVGTLVGKARKGKAFVVEEDKQVLKRPQGSCATKDKLKNHAMRECAFKAQVKSTINMIAITLKKFQIMEKKNALILFMIIEEQMLNSKAQKYLKLRHQKELEKVRHRL
ncbi:unnamed protein product [Sphagnum troendelagicum]|uniref:Uncharacterized protein n=1 Tax=Sphagnum troendelagicum TaxID=128251 RepID=A0ABP0TH13_9BRYO